MIPPNEIITAVNALLAPYGEKYTPGGASAPATNSGYTNWKGAAKYTGLSVSTLQRAVRAGELKAPHKMANGKNGAVAIPYTDLDEYVCRH